MLHAGRYLCDFCWHCSRSKTSFESWTRSSLRNLSGKTFAKITSEIMHGDSMELHYGEILFSCKLGFGLFVVCHTELLSPSCYIASDTSYAHIIVIVRNLPIFVTYSWPVAERSQAEHGWWALVPRRLDRHCQRNTLRSQLYRRHRTVPEVLGGEAKETVSEASRHHHDGWDMERSAGGRNIRYPLLLRCLLFVKDV